MPEYLTYRLSPIYSIRSSLVLRTWMRDPVEGKAPASSTPPAYATDTGSRAFALHGRREQLVMLVDEL